MGTHSSKRRYDKFVPPKMCNAQVHRSYVGELEYDCKYYIDTCGERAYLSYDTCRFHTDIKLMPSKEICIGRMKNNKRCRRLTIEGTRYCYLHDHT